MMGEAKSFYIWKINLLCKLQVDAALLIRFDPRFGSIPWMMHRAMPLIGLWCVSQPAFLE